MSEDGGPAYPRLWRQAPHEGCTLQSAPGMSLRERFAVAIAGRMAPDDWDDIDEVWVLHRAQALTDEAMKRRGKDQSELTALQLEVAELRNKVAEFIDGEQRGEPLPRPGDE